MTPSFALLRLAVTRWGTYGVLEDAAGVVLVPATLEPPTLADGRIPAGTYSATRCPAGFVIAIDRDPPALLTTGNVPNETQGNILVGSRVWTFPDGQHGVAGSPEAFEQLQARLAGIDTITLMIRDPE